MTRANPAVVGGFVVGAIALIVVGLLLFGGTGWFVQHNRYIAYFPGSVKGLQVGAPVDFRGVTIGEVTEIRVLYDPQKVSARIPVIMELDPTRIEITGRQGVETQPEDVERLIEAGFRAQLQSQSLLTGLLFVNLDFYPDKPPRLVGGDEPYPEIPTIPSDLEQLQQTAGDVAARMPALLDQLNGLLTELNQALDRDQRRFQQHRERRCRDLQRDPPVDSSSRRPGHRGNRGPATCRGHPGGLADNQSRCDRRHDRRMDDCGERHAPYGRSS